MKKDKKEKKPAKEKVKKAETPETKIAAIAKDVVLVEKQAKAMVIKTKEDYEKASTFLSTVVKPRVNRIKEVMDSFINPWKEQRKVALAEMNRIEAMFATSLAPLEAIESTVKRGMGDYLRIEDEKARKEEKRLADLREKQNERREEKGQDAIAVPLPTVERSMPTVAAVGGGKTTAKKVWKFEIQSRKSLPPEVVEAILEEAHTSGLTEKVVRKMVNAGVHTMSGVRIYEDFDISATAAKN